MSAQKAKQLSEQKKALMESYSAQEGVLNAEAAKLEAEAPAYGFWAPSGVSQKTIQLENEEATEAEAVRASRKGHRSADGRGAAAP